MIGVKHFTFNSFNENTYVIYNEHKTAFLLDPGNFQESETQDLKSFIDENHLQIKNILLTHGHIDHVLGLQWAYETYKVPVLLHEKAKEILGKDPMTASHHKLFFKPFDIDFQNVSDGYTQMMDEYEMKVYFVPGHSAGHVAYHFPSQKKIFSGDVLFEGGIGRTDLYKSNYDQLLDSIRTKLFVLDNDTLVFPGHGHYTRIGYEKRFNPYFL